MTPIHRRQLLKALGLGGLLGVMPRALRHEAKAQALRPPTRVVFFVQPHGHVPSAWNMPMAGAPADTFAERPLTELAESEMSAALRPLYPYRKRTLVIEGLAQTSVLHDRAQVLAHGSGDDNDHNLAVAGVLTGARALQREGLQCSGGARSLDQELARRLAGAGRFDSRVYGADYVPNQAVSPFSFLASGMPSPVVKDPAVALADLLGLAAPSAGSERTRAARIRALRGSVLDHVGAEFADVLPRVSSADRQKLESHRALVRDLETRLAASASAVCDTHFDVGEGGIGAFMRLVRLAFACDLTRVVTYVAPVPQPPEFGYPAEDTVHFSYAHASVSGATSCGAMYTPRAERAMTDLGAWYARHLASMLAELDAVPEGEGTLLDHTLVVWVTELATPTHRHEDTFLTVIGDLGGALRSGRYVRYPRTLKNPMRDHAKCGPGHNRLFVTLLRALGFDDASFGLEAATAADGSTVSLSGPLRELLR